MLNITRGNVALKFSPASSVSSFFQIVKLSVNLSYAIHFWVYLTQPKVERTVRPGKPEL